MAESFWRWLALFAYRHWARYQPVGRKPVGVPGNRDPDLPCPHYAPRPTLPGEWCDCLTDGHYLCGRCCHRDLRYDENWLRLEIVGESDAKSTQ